MNAEMKSNIENQIHRLSMIDGTLDVARDCFSHFQNHQPTQTQLDQYSTHGHESVEASRKMIREVIAALEKIKDSN